MPIQQMAEESKVDLHIESANPTKVVKVENGGIQEHQLADNEEVEERKT